MEQNSEAESRGVIEERRDQALSLIAKCRPPPWEENARICLHSAGEGGDGVALGPEPPGRARADRTTWLCSHASGGPEAE